MSAARPIEAGAIDAGASVAAALERVRARITAAALLAGRDPRDVELIAVTKGVPLERIAESVAAGQALFGENRVQEAEAKLPAVEAIGASVPRWHLIGHLQSNKARRAVGLFEAIQSVDSLGLAIRLDRLAAEASRRLPVYLQVNVDRDPAKTGFQPQGLRRDLDAIGGLGSLELVGLMTVGSLFADPDAARPTFRALAELSAELRAREPRLGAGLSMGMSDDYEVAIEEGATCVRVGRAIFGERRGVRVPVP